MQLLKLSFSKILENLQFGVAVEKHSWFKLVLESRIWRSASNVLRPRPESLSAAAAARREAAPGPLNAPAPRLPLRRTFAESDE